MFSTAYRQFFTVFKLPFRCNLLPRGAWLRPANCLKLLVWSGLFPKMASNSSGRPLSESSVRAEMLLFLLFAAPGAAR
jgi:hypothetical protein